LSKHPEKSRPREIAWSKNKKQEDEQKKNEQETNGTRQRVIALKQRRKPLRAGPKKLAKLKRGFGKNEKSNADEQKGRLEWPKLQRMRNEGV